MKKSLIAVMAFAAAAAAVGVVVYALPGNQHAPGNTAVSNSITPIFIPPSFNINGLR